MFRNERSLTLLFVIDVQIVLLYCNRVFDQGIDLVHPAFQVLLEEHEHAVFQARFIVDYDLEAALLDEAGRLRPPDGLYLRHLVAECVIHQLLHHPYQDSGFDIRGVEVALLYVGEEAILLHLSQEKALERIHLQNGFLAEVVVLQV